MLLDVGKTKTILYFQRSCNICSFKKTHRLPKNSIFNEKIKIKLALPKAILLLLFLPIFLLAMSLNVHI